MTHRSNRTRYTPTLLRIMQRTSYPVLFRYRLDANAIADIRLALSQGQPLGNARFMDTIERMTGQRPDPAPDRGATGRDLNSPMTIELRDEKRDWPLFLMKAAAPKGGGFDPVPVGDTARAGSLCHKL